MRRKKIYFSVVMMLLVFMLHVPALASGFLVREGMQGENVRAVQALLIEQGFLEGEADGVCGRITVAAIRHFQKDKGLQIDGVCGPQTYARLRQGSAAKSRGQANGQPARDYRNGRVVYVSATGYSAYDPGNVPTTASGTLVHHGIIAVDPYFLPLGTRVFIPGYGEAVAEDTGWGIRGNLIDIAFDTHEEALEFGRQDLEIYVLE